jgi:hypothetical protein
MNNKILLNQKNYVKQRKTKRKIPNIKTLLPKHRQNQRKLIKKTNPLKTLKQQKAILKQQKAILKQQNHPLEI